MTPPLDVVTGAFSYTGRAIAERLLSDGVRVRTLTRRGQPDDPLAGRVETAPLQFEDERALVEALRGARNLFNTYWIRFEHGGSTFARAVENTVALFRAARDAGVERVVHISVSKAVEDSPLPYFRGKARLERELRDSGLRHAIVRPTLIFGPKDILVNNIAWILRRFPLFLVPGRGDYRVQPVSVDDTAEIAVRAAEGDADVAVDAAGPEVYSFGELVGAIRGAVGSRARILHAPPRLALGLSALVGLARSDVLLTRDEVRGLMDSLLVSEEEPRGTASFGAWLAREGPSLGRSYVSEMARNFRSYAPL